MPETVNPKPLREGELLVAAWVDKKDFLKELTVTDLFKEIASRSYELVQEAMTDRVVMKSFEAKLKNAYRQEIEEEWEEEGKDDLVIALLTRFQGERQLDHGTIYEYGSMNDQILMEAFDEACDKYTHLEMLEKLK